MKIKIKKLREDAVLPRYATEGSACFDIFTFHDGCVEEDNFCVFDTGLAMEVPEGHVLLIFSRSGHGFKHDIRLSNCVGVIDSDYRGEIKVKLRADGRSHTILREGSAVAQGLIIPYPKVEFEEVDELSTTERGSGGFGSTGI